MAANFSRKNLSNRRTKLIFKSFHAVLLGQISPFAIDSPSLSKLSFEQSSPSKDNKRMANGYQKMSNVNLSFWYPYLPSVWYIHLLLSFLVFLGFDQEIVISSSIECCLLMQRIFSRVSISLNSDCVIQILNFVSSLQKWQRYYFSFPNSFE